jgi:hypothetical protein
MENQNSPQLELFTDAKDNRQAKPKAPFSFLRYVSRYEKAALFIIGFIITGIVSFSLGIERGKRTVSLTQPPAAISEVEVKKDKQLINADMRLVKELNPPQPQPQPYTIQVASYQSKVLAEKEAEALRRKGFSPLVFPKGAYVVVCVGNFANKETARSSLSELKKRYQDCFIRRL